MRLQGHSFVVVEVHRMRVVVVVMLMVRILYRTYFQIVVVQDALE